MKKKILTTNKEQYKQAKKQYKVKNQAANKTERIAGKKLPHIRTIKLYDQRKDEGAIYLPIGAIGDELEKNPDHTLDKEFIFEGKSTSELTGILKEMSKEQDTILFNIMFDQARTGVISMKTARGKSFLMMKMMQYFQEKTLILCHNIKTLKEMEEKIESNSNYTVSLRYGQEKELSDITITTHMSFADNVEVFAREFGLILYDECDRNLIAKTGRMITALAHIDADAFFGLSGTPYRDELKEVDFNKIFGGNKYVGTSKEDIGYNVVPDVTILKYENTTGFSYEDFHELRRNLFNDEDRVELQAKKVKEFHADSDLGLLIVTMVEACNVYKAALDAVGIPCRIINGQTNIGDDEESIELMKNQGGIIIGTLGKMGRGVDIPAIDTLYMFASVKFSGLVIQTVGRALRVKQGKKHPRIIDRNDELLKRQGNSRRRTYEKEYKVSDITIENL